MMPGSLRLAARFRPLRWLKCNPLFWLESLGNGRHEAVSLQGAKASCGATEVSFRGNQGTAQDGLQESLWQKNFSDPTEWWDNRRSKASPLHPDFGHKKSKEGLWLNNCRKPAWVESQLAMWDVQLDAGMGPAGSVSTLVQGASYRVDQKKGHLQLETCRKLCEDGHVSEAVDTVHLLMQRGCRIPSNLLYRVLKKCIVQKDLVLGRRVHALILTCGYESNAFLANHLICMYSSHGSLAEAMQVFSKVSAPDVYMWASMILAYTRHGQSTRAIELYRHISESTVKPDNRIFVAALKACATAGNLAAGKDIHAHILASAGKPDMFVQNCLIEMYVKCRCVKDARTVFDRLPHKDVVAWNALISGYVQQGMGHEALTLYSAMQQDDITQPNSVTFLYLLRACVTVRALHHGKQLHAQIKERGLQADVLIGTSLINMYCKCGSLQDAQRVFDILSQKNVGMWNAMFSGYSQRGMYMEMFSLYRIMRQEGITPPDPITFVCLLQACTSVGVAALHQGKQLHAQIEEQRLQSDVVVGNSLVNMYAKCGSLEDAQKVFDGLVQKDVVTWNAIMAGYAQWGMVKEALYVYSMMQQEGITSSNSGTFVCLLQACSSIGVAALQHGKQLHAHIEERGLQVDVFVGTSLVNMYAKCGRLDDARKVFDKLSQKDVVAWNAMIAGYAQRGMGNEALILYSRMQQEGITSPNSITFVCLLKACASVGVPALDQGKQLHAQIKERGLWDDLVVSNSLVNMYAKCRSLQDAEIVFDGLTRKDVVTWNTMIAGYAQEGMCQKALSLYSCMQQEGISSPNSVTFLCLLQACASVATLPLGKQLHAQIEERGLQGDIVVATSLIDMYAKCGSLDDARNVFDRLSRKDVVTWNAMITGYVQARMGHEALGLYSSMQQEGRTPPDAVTFVCLLQACANGTALHQGKKLHAQIEEQGLQADVLLGNSLVNMYAKCGSLDEAQTVFDRLPQKDVVTWNALLAGYAQQGVGQKALSLYSSMQQEGVTSPDSVTFVCLLQACARLGAAALDQGTQLHTEIDKQGLQADMVVGNSLVNMYAKCGSLENAERVFDRLCQKDVVTWNAMITGYAQQGRGQEALTLYRGMQQESNSPPDSFTFVSLLQACASVGTLPLGKELIAQIEKLGLQEDPVVGASMMNMYAKCGSLEDAQRVFDRLPQRNVSTWNALITGYARQGESQIVFDMVDRMRLEGIQPDGITLLSMLTVCSHLGLVDRGRKYFEAISTDHGITPTIEHYTCMIDLLGRAGHLDEAQQMVKTMPVQPTSAVWRTLLGACQKWSNVEIGRQAFECAVTIDEKDPEPYVVMSNIYAAAHLWEEARDMQARRVRYRAWKEPGRSWWTDTGGVMHSFVAGDKKHPESDGIYARLDRLLLHRQNERC